MKFSRSKLIVQMNKKLWWNNRKRNLRNVSWWLEFLNCTVRTLIGRAWTNYRWQGANESIMSTIEEPYSNYRFIFYTILGPIVSCLGIVGNLLCLSAICYGNCKKNSSQQTKAGESKKRLHYTYNFDDLKCFRHAAKSYVHFSLRISLLRFVLFDL